MFTLAELEAAARLVHQAFPPTPQIAWPLLAARCGTDVHVKHENHAPTGAFKVRGGIVYLHELLRREPRLRGVVSATRGNHGQSIARAAAQLGLKATIVVPHGNSVEKNAAMRALGASLVEHGDDFQQAREHAAALSETQGLHLVPSLHRDLVRGVATYWVEFFEGFAKDAAPDVVFVPIGLGSGISGCVAARAYSGVSVASFQNQISVQAASAEGIAGIGPCALVMARAEGLDAHANAVALRLGAAP